MTPDQRIVAYLRDRVCATRDEIIAGAICAESDLGRAIDSGKVKCCVNLGPRGERLWSLPGGAYK